MVKFGFQQVRYSLKEFMDCADFDAPLAIMDLFRLNEIANSFSSIEIECVDTVVSGSVNDSFRCNFIVNLSEFGDQKRRQTPRQEKIFSIFRTRVRA